MSATTPGKIVVSGKGPSQSPLDKRLDEELTETFPASDPPSAISPGAGETPRPRDKDQPDDDADANN